MKQSTLDCTQLSNGRQKRKRPSSIRAKYKLLGRLAASPHQKFQFLVMQRVQERGASILA
jgi:hypothetical protein